MPFTLILARRPHVGGRSLELGLKENHVLEKFEILRPQFENLLGITFHFSLRH